MRSLVQLTILSCLWILRAGPVGSPPGTIMQPDQQFRDRIARFFAPVIYQNTEDDRRDFITRFDFDGDRVPTNQGTHVDQPQYTLPAYVYQAVVAGKHHYFIGYGLYHPVDYKSIGGHENDFEGLLLVVERNADGSWGSLLACETLAHDQIYQYPNNDGVRDREEDIDFTLSTRDDVKLVPGIHPEVIVEARGHGIFAFGHRITLDDPFVQYEPGGDADVPSGPDDGHVTYVLLDLVSDDLWLNRRDTALYKDRFRQWTGAAYEARNSYRFLAKFHGYGSKFFGARPPWAWDDWNDGVQRGDWFIAPAFAYAHHLFIPGLRDDDLNERDYYDWNGFMDGQKGTNPPFNSAVITVPFPQEARAPSRRGETLHAFSAENLKAWVPPTDITKIETDSLGPRLRLYGQGEQRKADSVATLASGPLAIPLSTENGVLVRFRNPYGVPAANVTFEYRGDPDGPPQSTTRTILLPSLTAANRPGAVEGAMDQVNEVILELPAGPKQILRKVLVEFTGDVSGFTKSNRRQLLPRRIQDQLTVFSKTPLAERSIDLYSISIVTRAAPPGVAAPAPAALR